MHETVRILAVYIFAFGFVMFPFGFAIFRSFLSGKALHHLPVMGAASFDVASYAAPFEGGQYFGHSTLKFLIVATFAFALSSPLDVPAAYAFGHISFRSCGLRLIALLIGSMFTQVAVMAGMYELMHIQGLYNRGLELVPLYTLPLTAWVLTTFLRACRANRKGG